MTDLREKTVTGARWSSIESIAGQGLSFFSFLILARLLSPADFGTVAIANLYVGLVQMLIFQGLGQVIIQKEKLEHEHLDAAFWINITLALALMLVTLLVCHPFASWFHDPILADLLRWLSWLFLISALADVQINLLARQFHYKALALRTLASSLAGGLVGVTMACTGHGVWSLVGQQLTIGILSLILLWNASEWRPRWHFSISHALEMWRFGSRLLIYELVSLTNRRSDQFFVGKYMGATATGIYAVAARVSTLLNEILVRSLGRLNLASLSRLQVDPLRLSHGFFRMLQMQLCLILPAAIGIGLFAREVVLLTVGSQWISAVPVMRILVVAIPFEALSALNAAALVARGKPGWISLLTCTHALLNISLFALCARWGLVAVATAFVVRAIILYPIELLFLRKIIPITFSRLAVSFWPPCCALSVMIGADLLWRYLLPPEFSPLLVILGGAMIGLLSYTIVLGLLRRNMVLEIWSYLQISRPGLISD